MSFIVEQHRRYLPHYQEKNRHYSLNWRLDGELPAQIKQSLGEMKELLRQFRSNDQPEKAENLLKHYIAATKKYDEQLGKYPPTGISLCDNPNGNVIRTAFHFYDGNLYDLHAYCIMPNHIHLLIRPFTEDDGVQVKLSEIVKRLKSYTSREIGKLNNSTGKLWRADYFDRQIRNESDYYYSVKYILNNPVKAGLIDNPDDWRFSYYYKDDGFDTSSCREMLDSTRSCRFKKE